MINNMPIQKTSKAEQQSFIKLVNKIIQAKQDGKDTTDYEAQIDELVYKLYNLSPTEIKIIKQSS